jgi:hypothetical protein
MRGDRYRSRRVRALIERSAERRLSTRTFVLRCRTQHAVMLPIPSAARRQVRPTLHGSREELRDDRQAEEGQQENGDELTQYPIETLRLIASKSDQSCADDRCSTETRTRNRRDIVTYGLDTG